MGEFERALQYSFLLLRYRERGTDELRSRLIRKKYTQAVIERTVAYLTSHGYLDDDEFVSCFVRERTAKGYGIRRIFMELLRLGVSRELAEEKIAEYKGVGERLCLRGVVKRKIDRYKHKKDWYPRLYRYLARRGFSGNDIKEVLDEYR